MKHCTTLSELPVGSKCIIDSLAGSEDMKRRLLDLGFSSGTEVKCVHASPATDPMAYMLRGTVIALRKEDSSRIYVRKGGGNSWG